MTCQPTDADLVNFVLQEARLLAEKQYDLWLALFAQQGRYWVPLAGAEQVDGASAASIADEDRLLLSLRIDRLKNPRAFSQHPRSHAQHVLQTPQVCERDEQQQHYTLYTPFIYTEARGETQVQASGHWMHRLCIEEGQLRILLKRVNLLNPGMAWPAIQLFP